ncbi:hypothetical protein [Bacteroides ilei]|uniref:hypothetical protein n=1 Tax=Bacteroides ilei TaxID=1907658 RepID=UPI0009308DE9|nr:hypothetical protein [Bacteroides ilei]
MMKIINTILLIIAIACSTSCDLQSNRMFNDTHYYNLAFNFRDSSGNNLLGGINESTVRELYIIPKNYRNGEELEGPDRFQIKYEGYLNIISFKNISTTLTASYTSLSQDLRKITYQIKCPYVFGDEDIHEFITYWDLCLIPKDGRQAKCYRIEYEGRAYTPLQIENNYSLAVITLGTP